MTQLRLMALVLRIMEDSNRVQYKEFCNVIENFSKSLDFAERFDFNSEEINLLLPDPNDAGRMTSDSKIRMIKARKERTGESLTETVLAAKLLYAANSWKW